MAKIEINGVAVDFILVDADNMERYENALEKMRNADAKIAQINKMSEKIRAYCDIFSGLFKDIFDSETAEKILNGVPTNIIAYEKLYTEFLEGIKAQTTEIMESRAKIISKYTPKQIKK